MIGSSDRPRRADAQRNRDALVAAARAAFAERGALTSLDDIAVRAGLGNATLYRHFPTREDLLDAALDEDLSRLDAVGDSIEQSGSAASMLEEWLMSFARFAHTWRGLPDSLVHAMQDEGKPLDRTRIVIMTHTEAILRRSQAAGTARADVSASEVVSIAAGLAWVVDESGVSDADLRRLVQIVLGGLTMTEADGAAAAKGRPPARGRAGADSRASARLPTRRSRNAGEHQPDKPA